MPLTPSERVTYIRALADEQIMDAATASNALEALKPDRRSYEQGLLLGLKHPAADVREIAFEHSRKHLKTLTQLPNEALTTFFEELMDYCFSYSRNGTTPIRARLLDEMLFQLHQSERQRADFNLDHLTARFVARGRLLIAQWRSDDQFATTVVRWLAQLTIGQRSDHEVLTRLDATRKLAAFSSGGASRSVISGFLMRDGGRSAETLTQDDFIAYSCLLNAQTHPGRVSLMYGGLQNLYQWLREIQSAFPNNLNAEHYRQIRLGSWDILPPFVRLHVYTHRHLLPGSQNKSDLFYLLKNRYRYPKTREEIEVVVVLLQLLSILPAYRHRLAAETLPFLSEQLKPGSEWPWELHKAALEMLGCLGTGLAEASELGPPEDAEPQQRQVWERIQRQRASTIRAVDLPLRRFLEGVSDNSIYNATVREEAWRILLSLSPQAQERGDLFRRGLAQVTSPRFFMTLQMVSAQYYRDAWQWIAAQWGSLTSLDDEPQTRLSRLRLVTQTASLLGIFPAFVSTNESTPAPLIALALDDPDPAVRQTAETAFADSGYMVALEIERNGRALAICNQELTKATQRANNLQEQLRRLGYDLQVTVHESDRLSALIEYCAQRRAILVSKSQSQTVLLQTRLLELRQQLETALKHAAPQEGSLRELHAAIQGVNRKTGELQKSVNSRVEEHDHKAKEVVFHQNQIRQFNDRLSAIPPLAQLEAELTSLNRQIELLEQTTDPDNHQALSLARYRAGHLTSLIHELTIIPDQLENEKSQLAKLQRDVSSLKDKIETEHKEASELHRKLNAYEENYRQGRSVWEKLREQIEDLQAKQKALAVEQSENEAESQKDLYELTRDWEAYLDKQASISSRLNELGELSRVCYQNLSEARAQQERLAREIDALHILLAQQKQRANAEYGRLEAVAAERSEEYRITQEMTQAATVVFGESITYGTKRYANVVSA